MFTDSLEMFKEALTTVLTDQGFTFGEKAQRARLCAERLLEWVAENREVVLEFCLYLNTSPSLHNPSEDSEMPWPPRADLGKLKASDDFRTKWATFLQKSVGFKACPIFFQTTSWRP